LYAAAYLALGVEVVLIRKSADIGALLKEKAGSLGGNPALK
jgi:hypothetical protein